MCKVKYFLSLCAIGLLILQSCGREEKGEQQKGLPTLEADAFIVTEQPFNDIVLTTAKLLPSEQVEIKTSTAGTVMSINFREGQHVGQGQAIVKLDDRQWQAEIRGVKAELVLQEKDMKRKKELLQIEGSSQSEIDKIRATMATLNASIQKLRVQIDLAHVKAPFSGVVGMRDFSKGAYLGVGETVTTLTNLDVLKVEVALPESFRNSIYLKQEIDIIVNKDTLYARIYAISPTLDASSRTFTVRANLNQPASPIMPGTFAEALVKTDKQDNAILVPTQAVVPEIEDQTVYVLNSGKAEKRKVLLGNRTATMVNIIEGVKAGDTVLTSGLLQVKSGMDIKVLSIDK